LAKKRDGWLRREMGEQEERWVAKKSDGWLFRGIMVWAAK
jgi:hypothetical protein